jgi:hypothetical protein
MRGEGDSRLGIFKLAEQIGGILGSHQILAPVA